MKRKILLAIVAFAAVSLSAQKNVGAFLQAGKQDASVLAKAYLSPYGEMLGTNLNSGWYNSAAPHKMFGFDVTLSASYTMVPTAGETFDVSKLDLTQFDLKSGSSNIAPTMAGEMSQSKLPVLTPKSANGYVEFTLPNGSGANTMISPMVQAGVGLPFHTELMLRYMPDMKLGEYGKIGMWGLGVKHSLKEYVPFLNHLPFWNVSVLGAYTNFTSGMALPDNSVLESGNLDISSNAYTARLLVGANLPVVAFYTGVGYGNASSNFDVSGSYNGAASANLLGLKYDNGGFDFNAGMRIRLGIIALHADYSVGDYQMITAGLGLSFR